MDVADTNPAGVEIDEDLLRRRVKFERTHEYMQRQRLTAASGALPSAYLGWLIWNFVPHAHVLGWWLCLLLVDATSVVHTSRFLTMSFPGERLKVWRWRQTGLQAVAGVIWGSSLFLIQGESELLIHADTAIVLVAVSTIGVIGMLQYRSALVAYMLGIWTPALIAVASHPTTHNANMAVGLFVLVVSMNFYLWKASVQLIEGIEKRFRADALAQSLSVAVRRIHELATRDELTGLPNRRQGMKLLQDWLTAYQSGSPDRSCVALDDNLGILLLDIDHFKQVNDGYGHPAGDQVLRVVGQRMQAQIRPTDVLARVGGEEFMVLLPRTPPDSVVKLATRLCEAVAASPVDCGNARLTVTISIGVVARAGNHSLESLLSAADVALYGAKRGGRNRVELAV